MSVKIKSQTNNSSFNHNENCSIQVKKKIYVIYNVMSIYTGPLGVKGDKGDRGIIGPGGPKGFSGPKGKIGPNLYFLFICITE